MIHFGTLLVFLFFIIISASVPEVANGIAEAGNSVYKLPLIPNKYADEEKQIVSAMGFINTMNQEIQDLLRADEETTRSKLRLQMDNEYVYVRQNASLEVLDDLSREYKNDSQVLSIIERKKIALKLELPNYQHIPALVLTSNCQLHLKVAMMPMFVGMTKNLLWEISNSTKFEKTRNRIEKEIAYIDTLDFKPRNISEYAELLNVSNITDALQLSEKGIVTNFNLTERDQKIFEEMKEFKLMYREKLENEIRLETNKKQLSLEQKTLTLFSEEMSMRDFLIHYVKMKTHDELLEKHLDDLSVYVFIHEKNKELSNKMYYAKSSSSIRFNLVREALIIYKNNQQYTDVGHQTLWQLNIEEMLLIDELQSLQDDYRKTVENEIKEYVKQIGSGLYVDGVMGLYRNHLFVYDTREKEEVPKLSINVSLEERTKVQLQKFAKLQTDVKEWNQTLFREYEMVLRKRDNQTINDIISTMKNSTQRPTSAALSNANSTLEEEEKIIDPYNEIFKFYLESRYKVDPFIFMRRLERIEKELNQLLKLTDGAKLTETIAKTLETIGNIDYTEISLEDKKQFDEKFAEAISKDKKTKIVNAWNSLLENDKYQKNIDMDFSWRERLILKRMKTLAEEYKQERHEKFERDIEGSGIQHP